MASLHSSGIEGRVVGGTVVSVEVVGGALVCGVVVVAGFAVVLL